MIEDALNKNTGKMPTGAGSEEVKNRYLKYSSDYAAKEVLYKQNVQHFQDVLKSQQAASTPDAAKICQSLAPMNASFQAVRISFEPILEMKNKGELNNSNLIVQLEAREVQQTKVQAGITATAAKCGCQLK